MNVKPAKRANLHPFVRLELLLILACILFCLWAHVGCFYKCEPKYAGRYLSQWLTAYRYPARATPETVDAVRHIGTNALPCLLNWIQYVEPRWRRRLGEFWPGRPVWIKRLLLGTDFERAYASLNGFAILGSDGRVAIPQLERLARYPKSGDNRELALYALGSIGQDGLVVLTSALAHCSSTNRCHRERLLVAIADAHHLGTDITLAVPEILRCMGDSDEPSAISAKELLLTRTKADPERLVRAVAANLEHVNLTGQVAALEVLEDLKDVSRPAVPVIIRLENSDDFDTRRAATNALRCIAPELLPVEQRSLERDPKRTKTDGRYQ
jgi:hypothetical protein